MEDEKPNFLLITLDPIADHNGAFTHQYLDSSVYEHYNVIEKVIYEGGSNFFEVIKEAAKEHGKFSAGAHAFHGYWGGFYVYPMINELVFDENYKVIDTRLDYDRSYVRVDDALEQGFFGLRDTFEDDAAWFGVSCSNGAPSQDWKYGINIQDALTQALGITTHAYTIDGGNDIYYDTSAGELIFASRVTINVNPLIPTYENGKLTSLNGAPELMRTWVGYDRNKLRDLAEEYAGGFEYADINENFHSTPTRTVTPGDVISTVIPHF